MKTQQPKGMIVLGFTEVFERLSYYTLSFLLVLYASAPIANGGLGWTKEEALMLTGKYTLAAFTLPLIGGAIADKFLGAFRASILGALLIIAGHCLMLFSSHEHLMIFYGALTLVASGTAFFKPSMPTLLGLLYSPTDIRREGGFNLYYMCINIGAMIAGFSSGLLLQHFGYQVAFASAGLGMIFGLFVFIFNKKHLVLLPREKKKTNLSESIAVLHLTKAHKKAISYLLLSFAFYAVWAIVYNIVNSGTLTVYTENYTYKTVLGYDIPTTFFNSLESIGIVIFAPLVAFVLTHYARKGRAIHFFSQMNFAVFLGFIAVAYFTHLTKVAEGALPGEKPFHYMGIVIFTLIISLSEVLISPVMMSAISLLSPVKLRTSFQAAYLSVIGLMGLAAGKIGAISISKPYETFFSLTILALVAVILYAVCNRFMVKAALKASVEMENK